MLYNRKSLRFPIQTPQGAFIIKQFFRGGKRIIQQIPDLIDAIKACAFVDMKGLGHLRDIPIALQISDQCFHQFAAAFFIILPQKQNVRMNEGIIRFIILHGLHDHLKIVVLHEEKRSLLSAFRKILQQRDAMAVIGRSQLQIRKAEAQDTALFLRF